MSEHVWTTELDTDDIGYFEGKYNKTIWADGREPAINAASLGNIETGIYALYTYLRVDANGPYYKNLNTFKDAINGLVSDIGVERDLREDKDDELDTAIAGEETRAKEAESVILSIIGDEDDTSETTVDGETLTVHARIQSVYETLADDLDDEVEALTNQIGTATNFGFVENKSVYDNMGALRDAIYGTIGDLEDGYDTVVAMINGKTNAINETIGTLEDDYDNVVEMINKKTQDINTTIGEVTGGKNIVEMIDSVAGNLDDYATSNDIALAEVRKTANDAAVKSDVNAKVAELEAADEANEKALTDHQAQYTADLALLQKADEDNADAIDVLNNTKVPALESNKADVSYVNTTFTTKEDFNSKINSLTLNDLQDSDNEIILDGGAATDLLSS